MKSKQASYQGRIVDVVEVKGGWSTVLDGMKQLKVRNSELSAPIDGKPNVPSKPGKVRSAKAEKPAKAKREPKPKDDVVRMVNPDLSRYTTHSEVKTASGRKAIDIDDPVANKLRGSDISDVYRAASEATGHTQKSLREKYAHLNPGMQRMNLGNLIRGAESKAAREAAKAKSAKQ